MNHYKIDHKILTLVHLLFLQKNEKPASFEHSGIEFTHCGFSHQNGWEKDEWNATEIVDQILTAKKANPNADTTALEAEIDKLVYELYGLTDEEIAIVEESTQ